MTFCFWAPSATATSTAETGHITGTVLDAETRKPLTFANVVIVGTSLGAMTVDGGVFSIGEVPPGPVVLKVMYMGRRSVTSDTIRVESGKTTDLTFLLESLWPKREAEARSIVGTKVDVSADDFLCEIVPAKEPFRVGDSPVFRVVIRNASQKMFYMVGAIDDSEEQSRYPYVTLSVEGPEGGIEHPRLIGCGFQNPLQERDFAQVLPWGTFEPITPPFWMPSDGQHAHFAKPGTYTVTFRYSSNAIDYKEWAGRSCGGYVAPYIIQLLEHVPRVEITSSIEVEVIE